MHILYCNTNDIIIIFNNSNNNNDLMVFNRVALLNHNTKNTKNKDYKYIYKFRKIKNELRCCKRLNVGKKIQ